MNSPDPWQHLVALARTSPDAAPVSDPADDARFAARVVARWVRPPPPLPSSPAVFSLGLPWEAWSLRGVAAAGVLAALMLAWNLPLLSPDSLPDDVLPPDSVAELAAAF